MVWLVFTLMTCAALLAILWPLARGASMPQEDAADVAFYREQIAAIERELARAEIDAQTAQVARTEAGRRLLAVARLETSGGSSRGRLPAALLAIALMPALSFGLYSRLGRPDLRDQPLQARLELGPLKTEADKGAAAESQVERRPDDGAAYERMAEADGQLGKWSDAAQARAEALRLLGETPERLTRYAEALSYAAEGVVTPQAVEQLERALALDPRWPEARYLVGLAAAQHDDVVKAREVWTALAKDLPPGSSLRKMTEQNLALLEAPVGAQ